MTSAPSAIREVTQKTALWNPKGAHAATADYIDVSAVSREDLAIHNAVRLPVEKLPSRARKLVQSGDTIFATIRPGLRRVAIVPPHLSGALASTAFCVLRPDPNKVDPLYLFFAVSSDEFVQRVAELQTGASYPAVRDRDVLDQEIDLHDPADQRSIGLSLNAVWQAVLNEGRAAGVTEALKHAAMRELFTRGLHGEPQKDTPIGKLPEGWIVADLGSLSETISKGSSPKWQGFEYVTDGVLFVRSQNVENGRLDLTNRKYLSPSWNSHEPRSILRSGDVLVNLVGASIGRIAAAPVEVEGANCNQAVGFVRLRADLMETRFLVGFLLSAPGQSQIHMSKKDIARANLSLEDVRSLIVPVPSLREQSEIAEILDAIDQKIDLHKRKKSVLEELFKALLQKLMSGDISVSALNLDALAYPRADEIETGDPK